MLHIDCAHLPNRPVDVCLDLLLMHQGSRSFPSRLHSSATSRLVASRKRSTASLSTVKGCTRSAGLILAFVEAALFRQPLSVFRSWSNNLRSYALASVFRPMFSQMLQAIVIKHRHNCGTFTLFIVKSCEHVDVFVWNPFVCTWFHISRPSKL